MPKSSSSASNSPLLLRRRPLFWMTAVLAVAVYWNDTALNGPFIYDDVASVNNNEVVQGGVPWQEAFSRDFWGKEMKHAASHKSYRPLTTLTLRWNQQNAIANGTAGHPGHTYWFHVANILLHGVVTGLITEVAAVVLQSSSSNNNELSSILPPLVCGLVFGLHPVHAEAVSNITSRGELLMSMFFLLAFLSYANAIPSKSNKKEATTQAKSPKNKKGKKGSSSSAETETSASSSTSGSSSAVSFMGIYVLPCLLMAMSMFSKEQGATTLCSLVAFDFIRNHSSVLSFVQKLKQGDASSYHFLRRTAVLAVQTLLLLGLRIWINGESSPDFVEEQNPAGFATERFTRLFSVNWTYCLYLVDMVFPVWLAPDWSGLGIPLIESLADPRAKWVLLLLAVVAGLVISLLVGVSSKASQQWRDIRQVTLMSFFAFLFLPFLLSSNILVTTGLAKADRVIYLPLFGYCLMQGLLCKVVMGKNPSTEGNTALLVLCALLGVQIALFAWKTHERNMAWSHEYTLWTKAYKVNPLSLHTASNAGRLMAKAEEYVEAEPILRRVGDIRTNNGNPSDTFLYAVTLSKMDRCEEAFRLIEGAEKYIHEKRAEGGLRYDPKMSYHDESSLLVARAFCTTNIQQKGMLMNQAVQMSAENDFAKTSFQSYMETVQSLQMQIRSNGMSGTPEQIQRVHDTQNIIGALQKELEASSDPAEKQQIQQKMMMAQQEAVQDMMAMEPKENQ